MRTNQAVAALAMLAAAGLAAGCRVDEHKNAGGGENVKVATPFGGIAVKTNGDVPAGDTGIDVYPGAQPVKKDGSGHGDDGAVDANMSFGSFKLRVKAATYQTGDSPEKVQAFYRTALAKFGPVLACSGDRAVGTPTRTPEGLTCDSSKGNHLSIHDEESGKIELKTGSQQHQRVVSIHPEGGGTRFGMVVLDLPGHLSFSADDSDKDSDRTSDQDKAERKQ